MRSTTSTGLLATLLVALAFGASGCGSDSGPIEEDRPMEEALKDSMDHMRNQYSKNKKGVSANIKDTKSSE